MNLQSIPYLDPMVKHKPVLGLEPVLFFWGFVYTTSPRSGVETQDAVRSGIWAPRGPGVFVFAASVSGGDLSILLYILFRIRGDPEQTLDVCKMSSLFFYDAIRHF